MRALIQGLRRLTAGVSRSSTPDSHICNARGISEEDPARYCPGGYHPVRIGDEFNGGGYRVISKLGYGLYSTVWLARNLRTNQHVALKVLTADSFGGVKDTFELEVLKRITSRHAESHHVLGLLDEFRLAGPNGKHVCLVAKAMGPDLSKYRKLFPRRRIPVPIAKKISKQLLDALVFLHESCQVIHTDIKPQNILLETTEINEMFAHAPSEVFMPQSPPLPPPHDYYMQSEQVSSGEEDLTKPDDISVRLADFGTSSFFDRHLTEWIQPPMLRAPEVILGAQWDHKVDIWNLGLIIWELVQGQLIFDGQATAMADYSSEAHLSQMVAILGPLPKSLLERSRHSSKYIDANGQIIGGPVFTPRTLRQINKKNDVPGADEDFEDFVSSMVRLEPQERPDAKDLLKSRWLADP
ncbi:kinase-like protein [Xylaria scruposa]|nr:kinase-like protein [Xylaria scruposa]